MNWIKQNTFLFGLAVATLVGALILWFLGSSAANRYDAAKEEFDEALQDAAVYERLDPYPTQDNLQSKQAELKKYSDQVRVLQDAFGAYRPGELEIITVQKFSENVKAANRETRKAFGKDAELPEDYFVGFEAYRSRLDAGNATGILNHQLTVVKKLIMNLAETGEIKLINVNRPKLPEEEGKDFKPEKGQVTRELPLELVFEGPEAAVREFLNSVVNDQEHFLVVRSLRIVNNKQQPPRLADAKFDGRRRGAGGAAAAPAANPVPNFDELFAPDPEPEQEAPAEGGDEEAPAPADGVPAPAPPAPAPVLDDDSRILYQVLGEEDIQVFVRIDLILFLEAQELP